MNAEAAEGPLPRVVACMPAWNAADFIEPVLATLAAQTYPNLEILISVDRCTDATAELCERFAAGRANVTVVRQPARLGWIGNSNALLARANGDYVFFAQHDDPLAPTYVERLVTALESAPDAVLAFTDLEASTGETSSYDLLDGVDDRFERARRVLHAGGAWWVPYRGLMRVSAVRRLGGLRRHSAGEYAADWPWLLRLVLIGGVVRVPEPLVCKRVHHNSLSSLWRKGGWNGCSVALSCMGIVRAAGFTPAQELYLYCGFLAFSIGLPACPPLLSPLRDALLAFAPSRAES
jgi:glycosyltransferase involved in cell wall biosynthesis